MYILICSKTGAFRQAFFGLVWRICAVGAREQKEFSIITEFMAGRKDPVYSELLALERI